MNGFRELKNVPQPPKRNRSGAFRKSRKKQGPVFDPSRAGLGPKGPKQGPVFRKKQAGLGPKTKRFGPRFNRRLAGLGPRGPRFGPRYRPRSAGLGPRGPRFGPRYRPRLAGVGQRAPKPSSVPGQRGGRKVSAYRAYRRSRGRGGPSLIDLLIRRIKNRIMPKTLTMSEMFRRHRSGDGRNHGYRGVKKPGKTGLAGR